MGLGNDMRHPQWIITRRDFLKSSSMAALTLCTSNAAAAKAVSKILSFGMVTDAHYADLEPKGTRYYRQSMEKMQECIALMNDKKVDFVIELGDLVNGMPTQTAEKLKAIEAVYAGFAGPRYHVLGNHDVESLSKRQFMAAIENTHIAKKRTYYSFDIKGLHVAVLDANYRADGKAYKKGNFEWTDTIIPEHQLNWLDKDLAKAQKPTIVFVHQLLWPDEDPHTIRNARAVRAILQKHNVPAVFEGHKHDGGYARIEGVSYYTLKAMVEGSGPDNNAYAIVEVFSDLSMTVTAYRKAEGMQFEGREGLSVDSK
jgi:3',5'-cyclic AMP phosphodiesterase CpdA